MKKKLPDKFLQEIWDKLKGQLVISSYRTVNRFIGIGEDDHDYFYIMWNGRSRPTFESSLCPVIRLKNRIDKKDYNELVRIATLNDLDFIGSKEKAIDYIKNEIKDQGKLLTEIYLNLEKA